MNKNFIIFLISPFFFSIFYANQSIISYELKYGNDNGPSVDYFENILDFNYYFNNGVYLFSQFEYSSPPFIGSKTSDINDLNNIFYIQYNGSNYEFTLGNLYLLFGRGLSINTFQDQTIDYDNSIKGADFKYYINDTFSIETVVGLSNVKSRINPADNLPSVSIENNLAGLGLDAILNNFNFHYFGTVYKQTYDFNDISNLMLLSNQFGEFLRTKEQYVIDEEPSFKMTNVEHNMGFDIYFGNSSQLYFERSLIYYNKILDKRTKGSKNYVSIYTNIYDFDILFELKDYNTPYLYNVFAAPPIALRESVSILASRNLHTVDFSNEIGYMFEINKRLNNSLNLIMSYSFAVHPIDGENNPNIFDNYSKIDMLEVSDFNPYKQYYFELSNTSKSEMFYYKFGYDYYHEITLAKGNVIAKTFPAQFSYNFKSGNSVTFYIESQNKKEFFNNSSDISHDYIYLNPTYSHYGKWTLSLFKDYEKDGDSWLGANCTYNFENSSQLSLFVGSQKGGLVCANGSCIMQPDFEDGFKLSYLIGI